jgi:hypothetical protein
MGEANPPNMMEENGALLGAEQQGQEGPTEEELQLLETMYYDEHPSQPRPTETVRRNPFAERGTRAATRRNARNYSRGGRNNNNPSRKKRPTGSRRTPNPSRS